MTPDDALDQPFMREMVEAAILAVALPRGIDQSQVARLVLGVGRVAFAGKILLLQRQRDFFRKADADETSCGDSISIPNEAHGFGCRDDLALFRVAQIRQGRMLAPF